MSALTWRCVACDKRFTKWWVAEDHVDNTPCASTLQLIWPTRPCECALHDRIKDGEHPERCYRCAGTIQPQ